MISPLVAAPHIRRGWQAFRAAPRPFVTSELVLFGAWVALELAVVALQSFGVIPNIVLHLAFLLLVSGLMAGLFQMAVDVLDGRVPAPGQLTASLDRGPSLFVAFLIYALAVSGGLFLLAAPGLYLAVRYAFFWPVLATRKTTPVGALREAGALSDGRWFAVSRFLLSALALNLAGAALLGLGLLITFPVSLLAVASYFRALENPTVPPRNAA